MAKPKWIQDTAFSGHVDDVLQLAWTKLLIAVWSQNKAVAKRDLIRLYSAHQTRWAPEQMWGIERQQHNARTCWKVLLALLASRGHRPPPKFTELLLSTTSVKIGSLPSQGPTTVLAGAIALLLQSTESHESQWTNFWGRFGGDLPSSRARKLLPPVSLRISFWLPWPKLRRLSHLIRCIACRWWYNWLLYIMRDVV